jgi:capsular exopolysaccharide synthesis family protein
MAALEFLKALRRRWVVVLACFVLATAVGYILSPEEPAEPVGAGYQASLTLIPSPELTTGVNLHLAAHLATGPDVARLAAEQLPADVPPAGAGVSAFVSPEAGSLNVTVTDLDAARAGILAEAYAAATIEFMQSSTSQSFDEALAAAEAELEAIEESIEDLQDERADDPGDEVVQARINTEVARYQIVFQRVQDLLSAEEPPAPLQVLGTAQVTPLDPGGIQAPTDRRARALLAGSVGLLLGLGLAITVDRLDTRLRERDEVEEAFGLPVLAEIPTVNRRDRADHALVTALKPDSAAAEAYRSLRSAITLVSQNIGIREVSSTDRAHESAPQVLVVTGAEGSQGKSTTVVNLAAAVAETGRSVLVIDCDFRKPEAHKFLDPRSGSGLADLVTGDFSGYLDQMVMSTSIRGVDLVSSTAPVRNPTAVVSRLQGLIADARGSADVILIDSSPLLVTSDAVDVLRYADAALVACRVGRTTYGQATRARRLLQRADVKVLGVVLTGTAKHRGTPYGQPSRRQRLLAKVASWAMSPGPDRPRPSSHDRAPVTPGRLSAERLDEPDAAEPTEPVAGRLADHATGVPDDRGAALPDDRGTALPTEPIYPDEWRVASHGATASADSLDTAVPLRRRRSSDSSSQ